MNNKFKLLSIFLVSMFLVNCTKETKKNVIKCQIEGLTNGDRVILAIGTLTENPEKVDSIVFSGQQSFELKTTFSDASANICIVPEGEEYNTRKHKNTYFFLEDYSVITIKGNVDELEYADMSGGLYEFPELKKKKELRLQIREMKEAANELYTRANNDTINQEFADSLKQEAKQIYNKMYAFSDSTMGKLDKEFVKKHPDVAYSAELLHYDYDLKWKDDIADFENTYTQLSDRVRNTCIGKTVAKYIKARKATAVGGIAPDFAIKDINGKNINLYDFKGKYVLFEFWGTWCGGCVQALPYLKKLRDSIPQEKMEMLSIACNEKSEKYWRKFVVKEQVKWHQALSKNKTIPNMFAVQGYPSFFFINPEGKILAKGFYINKIINKIKEEIK